MEAPRKYSIYPTMGLEGKAIAKDSYAGKTIAVFTSGGDAQGTDTYATYIRYV